MYEESGSAAKDLGLNLLLATYLGDVSENAELVTSLPVHTLHVDLVQVNHDDDVDALLNLVPEKLNLSLGLVDACNIENINHEESQIIIQKAVSQLGENRIVVAPSCSLLHTPAAKFQETVNEDSHNEVLGAVQKIKDVAILKSIAEGKDPEQFELAQQVTASKRNIM